jgi:hypothetical protein
VERLHGLIGNRAVDNLIRPASEPEEILELPPGLDAEQSQLKPLPEPEPTLEVAPVSPSRNATSIMTRIVLVVAATGVGYGLERTPLASYAGPLLGLILALSWCFSGRATSPNGTPVTTERRRAHPLVSSPQ